MFLCVFRLSLSVFLADSGKEIKGKENAKAAARIVGSDTNLIWDALRAIPTPRR